MNRPLKVLPRSAPQRSRQRPLPSWIPPMLATLTEEFPTEGKWVTPKLVGEVGFSEWTSAGLLRHPRYLGLRDDKPARQVRRED